MSKDAKGGKDKKDAKKDAKEAPKQDNSELIKSEESNLVAKDDSAIIREKYWKQNDLIFGVGDKTTEQLLELMQLSDTILMIEDMCVGLDDIDVKFKTSQKRLSKFLVEKVNGFKEKWENSDEIAKLSIIKLVISIVGEKLIESINSLDLKDPPPPKQKKQKNVDGDEEEGDEDEENEDEEEEEEEEGEGEGDMDDDMDSEEARNFKPKTNVDSITDIYHGDSNFVVKLMGGHYIESFETIDSHPKLIIDPDDLDFSFLKEL